MADLFSSLAQRVLPRLGQSVAREGGLRAWFTRGAYAGGSDPLTGEVILSNVNPTELIDYLAFDYERFALASWESFLVAKLESSERNLVAWPLLKLYYSSFFAAHALMRGLGHAIVKVDRDQTDAINMMVRSAGSMTPALAPGMFRCAVREVRPGQLEMAISPHRDEGGVHDGFWKSFAAYLDQLAENAVQRGLPESANFVAGVGELTPKLRGWLAARRNDVNYQQAFGVWYPLTRGRLLNDQLATVRRCESRSIDLNLQLSQTIPCFVRTTQFLSCLNAEVADHVSKRSRASGTFGSKWSRLHAAMPFGG